MRREFRNRVFLPIVVPLGILAFVAATVGLFAWILLYNTHEAALALATVVAAGILLTVALAASQDRLDAGRKAVLVGAGVLPLLIGVGYASGLVGSVDPALLNVNREPEAQLPEWAPVVIAQSASQFEVTEVTLPTTPPEGEQLAIILDNQDVGVTHDLDVLTEEGGEQLGTSPDLTGSDVGVVNFTVDAGEYFYVCSFHPTTMTGSLTVEEGAEPSPTEPAA